MIKVGSHCMSDQLQGEHRNWRLTQYFSVLSETVSDKKPSKKIENRITLFLRFKCTFLFFCVGYFVSDTLLTLLILI